MTSDQAVAELRLMLEDLPAQDPIHQPTSFWATAAKELLSDFETHGIETFRCLPSSSVFFVPTYGSPGNSIRAEHRDLLQERLHEEVAPDSKPALTLERMLSGQQWAEADYRVYLAGNQSSQNPKLDTVSESVTGGPLEHFCFGGRQFSRSLLNYLNAFVFLKQHVDTSSIRSVLEVGGGFGTLGEILAAEKQDYAYTDIDIPPTSAVASYYLGNLVGGVARPYSQTRELTSISAAAPGERLVLCPWQLPQLEGSCDLLVNSISFQEMEPDVVRNYCREAIRLGVRYVLLRNIREGKALKSDTRPYGVETPIKTDDYLDFFPGFRRIATNVDPYGYRTVDGFHSELQILVREEA